MAKSSTFKEFFKNHRVHLLSAPHAGYSLGDFAEIKRRFWLDIQNEGILDELNFPDAARKKYRRYLENLKPAVTAEFPELSLENEFHANIQLTIPKVKVDAGFKIDRTKIVKFNFSGIRSKVLDNSGAIEIRKIIDDGLDNLTRKEKKELRKEIGKLKRAHIVQELFFASKVQIVVQKEFGLKATAEAKLKKIKAVGFKADFDSEKNHVYSFNGDGSVPFAAKVLALNKV